MKIQWLGHAGVKVSSEESTLYIDPSEISDCSAVWTDPGAGGKLRSPLIRQGWQALRSCLPISDPTFGKSSSTTAS